MRVRATVGLLFDASERSEASHASGAGQRGPRERVCQGVGGTKSRGQTINGSMELKTREGYF
jgi:hypothetical protein